MFLRRSQIEKLPALSRLHGAPLAELVRRGIDVYLAEREDEIRKADSKYAQENQK